MSILIKGMEMPLNCRMCNFCEGRVNQFCDADEEKRELTEFEISIGRPDWCPLIEVPTPHGRLGDLDKLEQMFVDIDNAPYSAFDGEEPFYTAEDAAQIIRLAPTIIEREDGT